MFEACAHCGRTHAKGGCTVSNLVELRRIGDEMQSEASRLAEWVRLHGPAFGDLPYEVGQALIGVESVVAQWTDQRKLGFP